MERAYGLQIPQNLGEACNPRHTALLVYDMQVGIIGQIQGGPALVARVKELLETVRALGFRVFFMRHMSLPKEASGVFQLRTAMAWQRVSTVADVKPWFLRDSPGFQLVPELNPLPSEVIFDKITMSAFEAEHGRRTLITRVVGLGGRSAAHSSRSRRIERARRAHDVLLCRCRCAAI